MEKVIYGISVRLLSALHIDGGTNADGTRIILRTDGNAYIPATLFKGMVRENFTKLWKAVYGNEENCIGVFNADKKCECTVCRLFGKSGFQRSRIYFDSLTTEQALNYQLKTNVSIDRHLRKAKEHALVFSETVERLDDSGEPVIFKGEVTVWYPHNVGADKLRCMEAVLVKAIEYINYIGMGKSRGLGFVESTVERPEGGWLCEKR